MINIKQGVQFGCPQLAMCVAHTVVASVYEKYSYICTITSAAEGEHSPGSRHYTNQALDYRIRHLPDHIKSLLYNDIKLALGDAFDVVLHERNLHVEYDPKRGVNQEVAL